MTSLVRALRSFQSGSLTREELFAEVDHILEGGRSNETFLIETLENENTKVPLPDDVHEKVRDKIENAAAIIDEMKTEAIEGEIDPDQSRTRLATSLYFNGATAAGADGSGDQSFTSSAPMK